MSTANRGGPINIDADVDADGVVDVILVSFNSRELLLRACRSVEHLGSHRLIVVDNDSADQSAEAVANSFPDARVIKAGSNLGFGRAVNLGLAAGVAPFVLLLNSDAALESGAGERLLAALDEDPEAGAVGPMIRGDRGELELSVDRTLTLLNEARFKILGALYRDGHGPATRLVERRAERPREVRSLSASCLLLRRRAVEEIGGFDPRFFLYAEDVDLCLRLRQAGWHLLYEPAAQARHTRGASSKQNAPAAERAYRDSQLAFYEKHRSRMTRLVLETYLKLRYTLLGVFGSARQRERARSILYWLDER